MLATHRNRRPRLGVRVPSSSARWPMEGWPARPGLRHVVPIGEELWVRGPRRIRSSRRCLSLSCCSCGVLERRHELATRRCALSAGRCHRPRSCRSAPGCPTDPPGLNLGLSWTWKWMWGSDEFPEFPTRPRTWPEVTSSPLATRMEPFWKWASTAYSPWPRSMTTWLPAGWAVSVSIPGRLSASPSCTATTVPWPEPAPPGPRPSSRHCPCPRPGGWSRHAR